MSRRERARLEGVAWPAVSDEDARSLARYAEARRRLDEGLIRPELCLKDPERSPEKWRARMAEMRSLLAACGDPQLAYPAVHVTGTSGKGSVSAFVAEALRAAGHRVGLHTSPFLQSPTEKIWIDGELVSADDFADLVDWIWPLAAPRKTLDNPASIHGMASVAIAFEAFRRTGCEVAVVEAGCGGRFDLASFVQTAVAVVTTVGMDHAMSLGPELADIAWHKAGILRAGVPAVTGARDEPLEVIRREARDLGVELHEVEPGEGPFWERNARVAEAALAALPSQLAVPASALDAARAGPGLPARREAVPEPKGTVLLDGAHNPDKMTALAATLPPGCVVVLGCLRAKSVEGLVEAVRPVAAQIVATEPTVYGKPGVPAAELAEACTAAGLATQAVEDPLAAVDAALELAGADRTVVVTGSLYLAGQVRARWFPDEQVVLQRTPWPCHAR